MQEQIEHQWIKDSDFSNMNPLTVRIDTYVLSGKDKVMVFSLPDGTTRQMSVWGENKNVLVRKFGSDTDTWLGKSCRITLYTDAADGKKKRRIEA